MELLNSPRRPPEDVLLLLVMVLTGIFLAMAVLQAAFPHAFNELWEALVRAWGAIRAAALTYITVHNFLQDGMGAALSSREK